MNFNIENIDPLDTDTGIAATIIAIVYLFRPLLLAGFVFGVWEGTGDFESAVVAALVVITWAAVAIAQDYP